jgi:hypothetical protein
MALRGLTDPAGHHLHYCFVVDHFSRIVLANTFFNQFTMVLVKRELLSHGLIDDKAAIPLLYIGDRIERLELVFR